MSPIALGLHGLGVGLGGAREYWKKVLSLGPIAYWPLWEKTGSDAHCLINPAQNGNVIGVTWANDKTGPFLSPAPYFDGVNDQIALPSAYYSNMDHALGSAVFWAKADTGVWTDGVFRVLLAAVETDVAGNRVITLRHSDNNVMYHSRDSTLGGTNTYPVNTGGPADWFCWADTWSVSGNSIASYFNGIYKNGSTANALQGTPNGAFLGVTSGMSRWKGWMAHAMIFDYVLPGWAIEWLANP